MWLIDFLAGGFAYKRRADQLGMSIGHHMYVCVYMHTLQCDMHVYAGDGPECFPFLMTTYQFPLVKSYSSTFETPNRVALRNGYRVRIPASLRTTRQSMFLVRLSMNFLIKQKRT